MCFPDIDNITLRDDGSFRSKIQESHHTGTSSLERITNLHMIEDIVIDPMHLLYLGVVKKLVVGLWCDGKPPSKLCSKQISDISFSLTSQIVNIPCEFNRKPRSLIVAKMWKATEFRQFLLYTGPVVLKSVLNYDRYMNFLTLHVAITILSSSKYIQMIDYADSLLQYFVKTFIILYGEQNVSHNIHNLLHICNDSKKFGTLDKFSAFPFENYMKTIKRYLRKHANPLSQIIKRKTEQDQCNKNINTHNMTDDRQPILQHEHNNGPLIDYTVLYIQYDKVIYKTFILKTVEPDNCCCLTNKGIILIKNFVANNSGSYVIGNRFSNVKDFYTKPCRSSEIGIYLVSDLGPL